MRHFVIGNGQLKEIAQNVGILPSTGGFQGNGALSEDELRKTVALWQAQLPDHIVPHIFPSFGHVGVRLTVTDSAGRTERLRPQGHPPIRRA